MTNKRSNFITNNFFVLKDKVGILTYITEILYSIKINYEPALVSTFLAGKNTHTQVLFSLICYSVRLQFV